MKLDQRTIRFCAGFALLLLVGVSALIYPSLRAAEAASTRRDAVRATLEQAPDHSAMIAREAQARDTLASYAETSVKPIPEEPNSALLIRDITIFLNGRDILDRELSVSAPLTVGPIVVTPLTISFRAEYTDAHALLQHLERANRLLRVRSIRIARAALSPQQAMSITTDAPLKIEILLELLHAPPSLAVKPKP
ncbi:MAG: hypothetical protein AB7G17_03115 [Phycisphaerales bacterium]